MFDWHSEYMVIQARQRDMAAAAEIGRHLAEARAFRQERAGRPSGGARPSGARQSGARQSSGARRGRGLRCRLGAVLVRLGCRLQGTCRQPEASRG